MDEPEENRPSRKPEEGKVNNDGEPDGSSSSASGAVNSGPPAASKQSEQAQPPAPRQPPQKKLPSEANEGLTDEGWRRTFFWMFVLVLLAGTSLYVFTSIRNLPRDTVTSTIDTTVQAITNVSRSLAALAAQFNKGTVTMSMNSTGTELASTKNLQFKELKQLEIFTHRDQASTGFGYIPLPEVVVEARAPVQYTYYLNLDAQWRLEISEEDRTVHVYTPSIHFNKPSVDVSRMEYEIKKDSVLRDADLAMENLKKSITSLSYLKARENMTLVRETGREPVEEFVRQWLIQSYSDGDQYDVTIFFPGEKPEGTPPMGLTLPE